MDFNNMSTAEIVSRYSKGATAPAPDKQVEYSADYQRQLSEIDSDPRRDNAQKLKAKQLLSRAALSRIGK